MTPFQLLDVSEARLHALADEYRKQWDVQLCATVPDGTAVLGEHPCDCRGNADCLRIRSLAIRESLRWGEPTVHSCPGSQLIWAMPLMCNSNLFGGLVASVEETRVFHPEFDIRRAATDLRLLVERHDLTNAALLERHRDRSDREQFRAEAIQTFKNRFEIHGSLQDTYVREEPELVAALRRGDWGEARQRINNLLVAMLHLSHDDLELTKSYFMELVLVLFRTAVEAGGEARELLGANYSNITALLDIKSQEELAVWLHQTLEHILSSMDRRTKPTVPALISKALNYISEHFTEDIKRDEVAAEASMSPSHFSRMFRKHVGRSFVDVVNQMRVDRAAEFLVRTDKTLSLIAMEVGFVDQSYFTKVFRRYMNGVAPSAYRRTHRIPAKTGEL